MKISRDGKPEIRLRDRDVAKILELAKARNVEHYLYFGLIGLRGLRTSSVHGMRNTVSWTRERTGEKVTRSYSLPGIRKEDVKDDHIVVRAKGGVVRRIYVPSELMAQVSGYASKLAPGQSLVSNPGSIQEANDLCKDYAREAGIADWERAHPHRWRHYFGTYWSRRTGRDIWKVMSLMMHNDPRQTKKYIEDLSPEEEQELFDKEPEGAAMFAKP